MSLKRFARLAAGAGVTAGLAFGGLATVGTTSADAATASTSATYSCGNPALAAVPVLGPLLGGGFEIPATFTVQNLPDTLLANVPTGNLPLVGTFKVPTSGGLAGLLQGLQITLASVLGSTPLGPVAMQFNSATAPVVNGVATVEGQIGSFTPTGTGALPLPIPTSLDASVLTNNPLLGLLGVKCSLKPGSTTTTGGGAGGTFNVVKQSAKITAHAKRVGHKAVVKVKVKTTAGQKGVGSVVAKLKGHKTKTKALSNGKVKLVITKLKAGKNKIKLAYSGNGYTNGAHKKLTVRVR